MGKIFYVCSYGGSGSIMLQNALKKYGETATLNFSIDKSLIGGITVKVDDEVLDLSIRGKVQKLVNELNF